MMDLYAIHPMHDLRILELVIIRPNMNLGMIACALFILISGATLALSKREEDIFTFYKKRLVRVLIPFYIAYIICFIIRVINSSTIHIFAGLAKWRFIFTLMGMDEYLNACGVPTFTLGVGEWFLGCIILCYLFYPLLKILHKKHPIPTFILMTIYFICINYNYDKFNFVIPSHMNFFCQIYNFYLGMLLIDEKVLTKVKKWFLFITIPIILFLYLYTGNIAMPDNLKTTVGIVSIFITFYLFEDIISSAEWFRKFVIYFSKISLEIYLVHHFVIYQVDYMLNYRSLSGIETILVIITDLIITIILAIFVENLSSLVYRLMDKSKN